MRVRGFKEIGNIRGNIQGTKRKVAPVKERKTKIFCATETESSSRTSEIVLEELESSIIEDVETSSSEECDRRSHNLKNGDFVVGSHFYGGKRNTTKFI